MIPGLSSRAFWYKGEGDAPPGLEWIKDLEAHFDEIRSEVLALRTAAIAEGSSAGFQQYRAPKWSASDLVM